MSKTPLEIAIDLVKGWVAVNNAERTERIAAAIRAYGAAKYREGQEAGFETSARRAEAEPELEGPAPQKVLDAAELLSFEDQHRAVVRATKRCIAGGIRALKPAPMPEKEEKP